MKEIIEKIKTITVKSQTQYDIAVKMLEEMISTKQIEEIKEILKDKSFDEILNIIGECTGDYPYTKMARKAILNVLEAFYPEKFDCVDSLVRGYELDFDFNVYIKEKEREKEIIRHLKTSND